MLNALSEKVGISRTNSYYKLKIPERDWKIKKLIEKVLRDNPAYGHKNIARVLKLNKKRILRVMKVYGIKPYRRTVKKPWKKRRKINIYPNLLLSNIPLYPNHIWATDFTYIKYKGKWIYVSTVIDLFTREIVSVCISRTHGLELVVQTLCQALLHRPPPVILHSDQGSEYLSDLYNQMLGKFNIKHSVSAPGCPWENGYQEAFYKGFKLQLGDPNRFKTLGELVSSIYDCIFYYNHNRIHSALKTSPKNFLKLLKSAKLEQVESLS